MVSFCIIKNIESGGLRLGQDERIKTDVKHRLSYSKLKERRFRHKIEFLARGQSRLLLIKLVRCLAVIVIQAQIFALQKVLELESFLTLCIIIIQASIVFAVFSLIVRQSIRKQKNNHIRMLLGATKYKVEYLNNKMVLHFNWNGMHYRVLVNLQQLQDLMVSESMILLKCHSLQCLSRAKTLQEPIQSFKDETIYFDQFSCETIIENTELSKGKRKQLLVIPIVFNEKVDELIRHIKNVSGLPIDNQSDDDSFTLIEKAYENNVLACCKQG